MSFATLPSAPHALMPRLQSPSVLTVAARHVDAAPPAADRRLLALDRMMEAQAALGQWAAPRLVEAAAADPEWGFLFNTTNPETASFEEMRKLLHSAPTPFVAGLLYGQMMMRLGMSDVEQRPWG